MSSHQRWLEAPYEAEYAAQRCDGCDELTDLDDLEDVESDSLCPTCREGCSRCPQCEEMVRELTGPKCASCAEDDETDG